MNKLKIFIPIGLIGILFFVIDSLDKKFQKEYSICKAITVQQINEQEEYYALRFANYCYEYEITTPAHSDWNFFMHDTVVNHIHEYDFAVTRDSIYDAFIMKFYPRDTGCGIKKADSLRQLLYGDLHPWSYQKYGKNPKIIK